MCNKMAINGLTSVNSSQTCHSNFGIWVMIAQGYIPIQEKSYNIYGNSTRVEIVSLNLHDFISFESKRNLYAQFICNCKQLCQKTWREKNCIAKFQNTIYASIIQTNFTEQSANLQTKLGKIPMVFCSKDLLLVQNVRDNNCFVSVMLTMFFLHLESRIRSNDSIPASLNAIKRTFVAII